MGLPNGVHHLAICTKDMKAQVEFFTQVLGMELVALYWMHGVKNTYHGFVKMNDSSSIAFVQGPESGEIQPQEGVSHASWTAGLVAPGAMQHLALNVDTEEELLAMRDRLRSHDCWVMGPLDHGFCKSIYFAGPEGMMLEFSTSEDGAIDEEAWIDPEVVRLNGINQEELERYKHPQAFESRGGTVQNPAVDLDNPPMHFPPGQDVVYRMSDEDVTAKLSETTPPVQPKTG
jgi:catechol 2,3-dioxygenase-like lactoylglutathione lyase family enzyme